MGGPWRLVGGGGDACTWAMLSCGQDKIIARAKDDVDGAAILDLLTAWCRELPIVSVQCWVGDVAWMWGSE